MNQVCSHIFNVIYISKKRTKYLKYKRILYFSLYKLSFSKYLFLIFVAILSPFLPSNVSI